VTQNPKTQTSHCELKTLHPEQISKDDFMGEARTCVNDLLQKKALVLSGADTN